MRGPVESIEISAGIETEGDEAGLEYTQLLLTVDGHQFPVRIYEPKSYGPLVKASNVRVPNTALRPGVKILHQYDRKGTIPVFLVGP